MAKRTLSKARILSTAFKLVEDEGLDALSMRRLAERLETAPMSLYNYIPNKDALLDGLIEEMLGELELPPADGSDPKTRIKAIALAIREGARRHPEIFRIIAMRPPPPRLVTVLELEFTNLLALDLDPERATAALRITLGYLFGYTRLETGGFFPALGEVATDIANFSEVVGSSVYLASWDPDLEFENGLDALLSALGSSDE